MEREEAIKIVKSHYSTNKQMLNEALEFLIPELKESEDEKIRKAVIEMIHDTPSIECEENYNVCKNDILAWLEKQGKKKPTEWSEDDERIVTALMEGFRYHQLFNPKFGEVPNAEIISWIKSLKERLS
jgi:hypothetical protein